MNKQVTSQIDTQQINSTSDKQSQKSLTHNSGLKDFLGCLHLDQDPLEIQKEMRNEWN